jgi:hypothetical protein
MDSQPKSDTSKLTDKINKYFENISYSDLYNNDIWFTIIMFLIVFVVALYFFIISSLRAYKNSWEEYKCNPVLMPFAAVINSDKTNGDNIGYTINNFSECMKVLNAEVAEEAKKPIDSITASIRGFFGLLYSLFISVQQFIVYLFTLIISLYTLIENKLKQLLSHIKLIFMNTNDFFGKILSIFTVMYYTIILVVRSWKLIFAVFVLGWLVSIVIPTSITVMTFLISLITCLISFFTLQPIFIVGSLISLGFIPLIIIFGISYVVTLILFILFLLIYVKFAEFVKTL